MNIHIKTFALAACLALLGTSMMQAANKTNTVDQVTQAVTVSADEDYVITSSTPFATAGSVNITNTEHAVVIIKSIRPSKVISSWLKNHVYINGQQAVDGQNCQVKMYASGAIVMPYAKDIRPLTVFSEQNFEGTSVNAFGLENDGGFMNTLTEAKLNNKIRSFKLKRGYMVTFSTRKGGRGYSRCFIADKADLEVKTLPAVLDEKISSYRVFQWYNAKKAGIASDTRDAAIQALNASWCYTWSLGESHLPDAECVPNHIYENWPSPEACGSVTYSCHLKTNNEPGNAADDHPQSVEEVLANWENLMRTGLRLCSESSHDGSMNHLKAFMDSIDARGWRCDILDLHCYWPQGSFNNLTSYSNNYGNGRPIWISEWVWGASWNNNGAFAVSNRNDYQGNWANNYNGTKPILDILNSNTRVERYAFWNSEANCSKIYLDGKLSTLGEYYAKMNEDLGYNPANEFIPRTPRMYAPTKLVAEYDKDNRKVKLQWHEENGEYNKGMVMQMQKPGSNVWTDVTTVEQKEDAADYTMTIDDVVDGYKFRVSVTPLIGQVKYSNVATAVNENIVYGDAVTVGGKTMYLGGNILINGDFSLGLADWTNGAGQPIAAPYFQAVPVGGSDGGAYLQAYGNAATKTSEQTLRKTFVMEKGQSFYAAAAGMNNVASAQKFTTGISATLDIYSKLALQPSDTWNKQSATFTIDSDPYVAITFASCGGNARFDELMLCQLFDTQEEALADARKWEQKRVQLFMEQNKNYPAFNAALQDCINEDFEANALEAELQMALAAVNGMDDLKTTLDNAQQATDLNMPNAAVLRKDMRELEEYMLGKKSFSMSQYTELTQRISNMVSETYKYEEAKDMIKNPSFASALSWTVKAGTYTSGDQRTATQAGKTCWNAWWDRNAKVSDETTMAVKQTISDLPAGFYALECKATTQHYCETDQHAYIFNEELGEIADTKPLDCGLLDLPGYDNATIWRTLVTPFIYVNEGGKVEIGFEGSKDPDAINGKYIKYGTPTDTGDEREGWWCATDFTLRRILVHQTKFNENGFGTICLPYDAAVPDEVQVFTVAGILSDNSAICLEPYTESTLKAGYPYVFMYNGPDMHSPTYRENIFFLESGDMVQSTVNDRGLRGTFSTIAKYRQGCLVLTGGVWKYIEESSVIPMQSYSAYIYKTSELTALDSWSGFKLKTSGIPGVTAVDAVAADDAASEPAYDLAGRRVTDNAKGIVVKKGRKNLR